jgi:hypothetical protein
MSNAAQRLTQQCQKLCHEFSSKLFNEFIKEANEKLLEIADKARNNEQQVTLLESARRMASNKQMLIDNFSHGMDRAFIDFQQGKLDRDAKTQDTGSADPSALTLLEDETLEEDLAASSLIRRAETRYNEDLFALNQRMALLIGGRKISEAQNPIGPGQFAESFHAAIEPLELEIKLRVLLYKVFEKLLLSKLGSLYKATNEALINGGLLPNLKYSVSKANEGQGAQSTPPPAAPPEGVPQRDTGTFEPVNVGSAPQQPMQQPQPMQPQQQGWQQPQQPYMPGAYQPMPVPAVPRQVAEAVQPPDPNLPPQQYQQQLFQAIQTMQQATMPVVPSNLQSGTLISGHSLAATVHNIQNSAIDINQFEADVMMPCPTIAQNDAVSKTIHQEAEKSEEGDIDTDDDSIIDLVGLIFDYMLGDEHLPDNVKAVLSYLHTPYLKVAFLDKELFGSAEHPSRRLLDLMAEAGTNWVSKDGTSQFKTFPKIKAIVRRILTEFETDVSMFPELLEDFEEFVQKVQNNVELLEKRAAQKAEGEEKLRHMKRLVNQTVKTKMEGLKLPSPIIVLLMHPWAEYMTFVLLRHGEESEEWEQTCQTIDDLLWTLLPKTKDEDIKSQMVLQTELAEKLEHAFQSIAYDQAKANKLLESVSELQMYALQNRKAAPANEQIRKKIEDSAVGHEENQDASDLESMTAEEKTLVDKLQMVEFGTWIEFKELDGRKKESLKIAWFNNRSMRFMLVDHAGKQVATLSALEIARHMLNENAMIVSGSTKPFFERALENIFNRMRASAA